MRILAIQVDGLPSGEYSDFVESDVLQDYDAIVINADSIRALFGSTVEFANEEKHILDPAHGRLLLAHSMKRRIQVSGLLQKGGIVVAFMNPVMRYMFKDKDFVTNYDWLFDRRTMERQLSIFSGTGKTIDNLYTNHPFYEYLKSKPSWTAYADISEAIAYGCQILASAFNTHALSLIKKVSNGFIVLIPTYYSTDNAETLESCIQTILTMHQPSPVPDWVPPIIVPGQDTLLPKLTELSKSIEQLQIESKQIYTQIQQLEEWKLLLYEKGKNHLEPMVRNALSLIGFHDKSDTEQVADGFFSCEYGDAILEVEGSKDSIKIEKISQLIKDRALYFEDKKCASPKGILVGNPFCEEPLDNRPPQGTNKLLFTKELIKTAEKQDIAVLLSTDLYNTVSLILERKISPDQKQALRKLIFESTGLVNLC